MGMSDDEKQSVDESKEDKVKKRKKKDSVFRKSMYGGMVLANLISNEENEYMEKYLENEKFIKKIKILMASVNRKDLETIVDDGIECIASNADNVHKMLIVCKDVFATFDAMINEKTSD